MTMQAKWWLGLACLCMQLFLAPAGLAADKLRLQLKWTHAFQFAGYYAAKELGYYREVGIDVDLVQAQPGLDVVEEVVSGKSEYGVGTSSLILARKAGKPVVALAVIFQHSPLILVSRKEIDAQTVHGLMGKRIMLEPQSQELLAYLKREHLPSEQLKQVEHSFSLDELIDGKVDVISAYLTNEPFRLGQAGFAYNIFTPRSAGIDFYGDNLFTTEHEIRTHPERVKAFRAASLRGWEYAMSHQDEIIDMILQRYKGPDAQHYNKEFFHYEAAQTSYLMSRELIAIGYMNPGRWRHIADTYAELGMLPANFPLDEFLYDANPDVNLRWFYFWTMVTLLLAGIVGGVALYIFKVNRRLGNSLDELKKNELRLNLLSSAIEHSPTSVIITDADSLIEYVNPHFTIETGYASDEVIGKKPSILQSGQIPTETYQTMWAQLLRGEVWTGELINRRKNGEVYWEEAHIAPVRDEKGKTRHYVAVKVDVSERKQVNDKLAYLAHHDSLTHLPNRTLFFERLAQGLALAKRNKTRLALMYIDLDRFKPVNDTYGHAVGDILLQQAAERMKQCLRESDTVGRIGGDEFVALTLNVTDEQSACLLAEKMRAVLSQVFAIAGNEHFISASIGVAIYPDHGSSEIELAKKADIAMYAAKAGGRDQVRLYQENMRVSM
ncbi:diguanylate cyclase domain-containing protein [Undibacterium pigrum]|uniref:PAS domain S-box-containing protein/diguanylate cyclase (GGDEF)-like protein n=1 Tax=Undibacterium pigrum TaxID=401470 RepID=A0A318IUS7_9BURK|nr:diguanylate cyclase [Undibacterium pigrum]PXX39926.1 PAS domain S-box-containing protein/diguanylate cyclase (GGDEF)-like protein [Undibacterium pigrum]